MGQRPRACASRYRQPSLSRAFARCGSKREKKSIGTRSFPKASISSPEDGSLNAPMPGNGHVPHVKVRYSLTCTIRNCAVFVFDFVECSRAVRLLLIKDEIAPQIYLVALLLPPQKEIP